MKERAVFTKRFLQALGICSPYVAVLAGVFLLKNIFPAVLFYHAVLLACIFGMTRFYVFKQFAAGFHRVLVPLFVSGGLVAGAVVLYGWPLAAGEQVDLARLLAGLHFGPPWFFLFAVYACLVNPLLEEAFWRGCFRNRSHWPTAVDGLFAGYHALAVVPIVTPVFAAGVFAAMTFVGWLFRALARRSGGLLVPVLTHLVADAAILYAVWRIAF